MDEAEWKLEKTRMVRKILFSKRGGKSSMEKRGEGR